MLPRVWAGFLVGISWALLLGGCASTATAVPGYPLYPQSGGRLASSQIARLSTRLPGGAAPGGGSTSFIKAVDGRDVSEVDATFELLPGCHVVETQSQLLFANSEITWSANIAPLAFVFRMKPGHEYLVVVDLREGMSGTGRLSIHGEEQDPTGKETASFRPVPPAAAAHACRNPGVAPL